MKKLLLKLAAACSSLLPLAATPARAGFDPALVPADAQWIFFLDVNALRSSALGSEIMTMIPQLDLDAKEMPVKINVQKLIESLGSATAYGTSFSHDPKTMDGALIIRGTPDLRKMVEGVLLASVDGAPNDKPQFTVKELSGLGADTYEVQGEVLVSLPPGDAILVSKSQASLAAAQALLRKDKPSMARGKQSVLASLISKTDKTYLLAASIVPRDSAMMPKDGPQARILQMATAASVALGENGTMTTARIQIDATSADMADKLIKILQGFVAMLSFAETDDEALATFLRSVTVEKTPSGALLNLAYPTERLAQMLKTIHDDKAAAHQGETHEEHGGDDTPAPARGRVLEAWTADQDLGSDQPVAESVVIRSIEDVELKTGDTLWLNGRRHGGEHARYDYIEVTPKGNPAGTLRFEAENLRLENYHPEAVAFASGGEVIKLEDGSGSARLVFPAPAGSYTLTVAYLDEMDGRAPLSVSLESKSQPAVEAPQP